MNRDNICTWCNQPGHRAHNCPKLRERGFPLTGGDLFLATVIVALIGGWFHAPA